VTGGAFLWLTLALVAAVGDWLAVRREDRPLEYLCKPLTLVALIGAALALDPRDPTVRTLFVVALVASLAGDVFLMLPRDLFVAGLASFLVAHLAYAAGMVADGIHPLGLLVGLLVVVVALAAVGTPLVRGAGRRRPDLVVPVLAYMAVISAMLACAVGTGRVPVVIGAGLFYTSDAMIGFHRFVSSRPWAPLAIIVTYHVGQTSLVLSLV
jgi:uncharacterized membrane protein YhhN